MKKDFQTLLNEIDEIIEVVFSVQVMLGCDMKIIIHFYPSG